MMDYVEGLDITAMKIVYFKKLLLLADKTDITEEIVRFTSHVVQLTNTLVDDESIGRKVDFIIARNES